MSENIKQGVGILETSISQEPPFWERYEEISIEDFPIFVLGKEISKEDGIKALKKYISSRFWFTYRKNFSPIGGTGPSSDQGWGCMLRCAQMLLGETLLRRHIKSHFNWNIEEDNPIYDKILQMFFDEKTALYSIHQIAQMGVCEGKQVAEWFGPNTAAQVIKKLSIFDEWSNIAVHVALDNILVIDDCIKIATTYPSKDTVKFIMENTNVEASIKQPKANQSSDKITTGEWRPLLIMIPLRFGLTSINPCYLPAIQNYFKLPQCVGIIGGRPNHALYFVGISGSKLFYLDPHYCRPKTDSTSTKIISEKPAAENDDLQSYPIKDESFSNLEDLEPLSSQTSDIYTKMDDSTYHCQMLLWMEYESIDPSLALALFCKTRQEFEDLCEKLKKETLPSSNPPIFELLANRPKYWPSFEPYVGASFKIKMNEFEQVETSTTDEDFDLLQIEEKSSSSEDEIN